MSHKPTKYKPNIITQNGISVKAVLSSLKRSIFSSSIMLRKRKRYTSPKELLKLKISQKIKRSRRRVANDSLYQYKPGFSGLSYDNPNFEPTIELIKKPTFDQNPISDTVDVKINIPKDDA